MNERAHAQRTVAAIAGCAWLLASACGGASGGSASPGGSGPPPPSPFTLSGAVTKGPLNAATVVAYGVDSNGTKGAELARGTTASDGSGTFHLTLASKPTGPVLIEATGGTYEGESDGASVVQTATCKAIVSAAGSAPVAVNPVTDLAAERTLALARSGSTTLADALAQAKKDLNRSFTFAADVETLIPSFDVGSVTTASEAVKLGLLLIALDAAVHEASSADPDGVYAALQADIRDGTLDLDGRSTFGDLSFSADGIPSSQLFQDFLLRTMHFTMSGVVNGVPPKEVAAYASLAANANATALLPDLSAHYSCSAGTLVFQHNVPFCWDGLYVDDRGTPSDPGDDTPYVGSYYTCDGYAGASTSDPRSCPDGGIPIFHAQTIASYRASSIEVFVAQEVKPLTQADLDAMDAAVAGWHVPGWASGPLDGAQTAAINDMYGSLQSFYAR